MWLMGQFNHMNWKSKVLKLYLSFVQKQIVRKNIPCERKHTQEPFHVSNQLLFYSTTWLQSPHFYAGGHPNHPHHNMYLCTVIQ